MEQKACAFVQANDLFAGDKHPLHLHSDTVKWMSAFGRSESPCIAALCHEEDAYHSNKTKFFVVVHLDHHPIVRGGSRHTAVSLEKENDNEIVLLSSDEFHHHYGIARDAKCFVIGTCSVFPLSRVILGAQTQETFQWANGHTFEQGLMVTGACCKNLLVRQGDQFLAPPQKTFGGDSSTTLEHFRNLSVLECYPVKQGCIHANTEIIITEMKQCRETVPKLMLDKDEELKLDFVTKDLLKGLLLSDGNFDQQNDVVCCQELAEALILSDGDFINVEISELRPESEDSETQSIVSVEQEEEYLSIDMTRSGIQRPEQVQSKIQAVCGLRVAQPKLRNVFTTELSFMRHDTFYISPILWFNTVSNGKCELNIEDIELKVKKVADVPFAKEIHLSLVLSPNYSPSAQFDQTLMKHLSKARVYKKNDIVSIDTSGNVDFLSECDMKDARCQVLHYRVEHFGEDPEKSDEVFFQVDLKHTALFQAGTVNSFIPRMIPSSKKSDITSGLSEYIEQLKGILSPYVCGQMESSIGTVMVSGSPGCGKRSVISSVAHMLNLHMLNVNCHELMSDSSGATEAKINTVIQRATVYAPCILVLNCIECIGKDTETGQADPRVCSALQNTIESLQSEDHPIAVVAVTSNLFGVVSKLKSLFLHKVELKSLTENQRKTTLQQLISFVPAGRDIDISWIAKHTVGFTYGEIWELIRKTLSNARERITSECAIGSRLSWMDEINICAAGISCQHCDFVTALQKMQSQRADIIGVPKIPDVKWDDIGGLEEVKSVIKDTIQLPLEHPELVSAGLRRSGILLYGPPGTGKTLLAKAVATQCSLSFLSVKGPELINMYVGQSEENVRKVFSRARDAAPCVVFFDELDSLAPNRGRSGDSGGVMDRVVSQLLAELDGLVEGDAEKQIFVIGASNRPDLIDPALLRPGRFDKLLYVGINNDKADQMKILEAQTRRANLSPDVRLNDIIEMCPDNLTGADFYALTSEAMMNAIRRRIELEETLEDNTTNHHQEKTKKEPLVVEQIDFENAAKNIVPSVTIGELARYKEISQQMTLG